MSDKLHEKMATKKLMSFNTSMFPVAKSLIGKHFIWDNTHSYLKSRSFLKIETWNLVPDPPKILFFAKEPASIVYIYNQSTKCEREETHAT